jgi:tetratricopeptide (TPR) repeat protein
MVAGKINAFVDALLKLEEEGYENEAVDVLVKAHKDTGAYQFKLRIGDIKIRQMTRRYHALVARGDKEGVAKHRVEQLQFELAEYADRAANYPTDLGIKFELGRRQYLAGKLNEAIASLQQAQRDPRRHVQALSILGQAFAKKGLFPEAADTFEGALQGEVPEERAKELRYSLGDVLEKMNELAKAQEQFSRVAQVDYTYRDVKDRLDGIRKKLGSRA